jgi:hypothetical protein
MPDTRYPVVRKEYDRIWQKYCGFLDLSLEEFMRIQESLLLQQMEQAAESPIGLKFMSGRIPRHVEEFRNVCPLTTYEDYLPELDSRAEDSLPERPHIWSSTSGGSGISRRVPYTLQAYHHALDNLMSVFVLACSRQRGQSSLMEGDRILYNVAPSPYLSGILAAGLSRSSSLRSVMSPDEHDNLDFKDKVKRGFEIGLRDGVDIIIAMTSVLVKTGNDFNRMSKGSKLSKHLHPRELARLGQAYLRSRLEKRPIMPKDLWPVKALVGWGIDTSIYREQVRQQWGTYPFEFHACTEAGIMAVQSWKRNALTFIPQSNFYEFIPESEWLKSRNDVFYEPRTVLLSEVCPNERYEVVITSFYGMPFMRYRLGHLVRITALHDDEAQIALPQMVFETRADDLIDIAGFTRISEKAVAVALNNAGITYEDWILRKELRDNKPALHLYIELINGSRQADLASIVHSELMKVDSCYRDLAMMMEIHPLEVTALRSGSFQEYYLGKKKRGAVLAELRPPRMNAADHVVADLLNSAAQPAGAS